MLQIFNHQGNISLINETIIDLIPKKKNPKMVHDFRPISLCNTLYKCISKVLANRLKLVLHSIISIDQSAFLKGRQITDNILLANEIIHAIHSRRSGKIGWAAIKLDMEKAFDIVEWHFIHQLLTHVGFPAPFTSLILNCLSTVTYRLSINAICLHETNGSFPGIQIYRGAPLSHLLFADDSMLFSHVTPHSSDALNAILQLYNRATGQLVNKDKSSILFSPNTSADSQHQFQQSLHLTGEGFVSKYLGVPHCSVIARFWWGSLGTKEVHWKSWSAISVSNFFGGLGFRTFSFHNQALLAKQAWRVWTDTGSLLHSILKARYFKHSDFLNAPVGYNSSFTWRSLLWGRQLLKKGLVWKIGAGTHVPLSASNWIPGLANPTILHPIDPSQAFVSFFINHDTTWNVPKLKHFFPSYQVDRILQIPLDPTLTDSLIWGFHSSGLITVKSAYHLASSLASIDVPSFSNPNPFQQWWKRLWSLSVPPKIKHFTWKAFNHILPCSLNLFQKKILPQPYCSICGNNTESVTHALMDCPRAKTIWKLSRFKNFYYDYRRTDINEFYLQALQNISKQDFPLFIALIWHIWNTRNLILFNRFGTGFIFKIGHRHSVASQHRLLPGASTPIFAEGQALLQSLLWCLDFHLHPKFVFSDCLNLVSKVNNDWQDLSALSGLVSRIRLLFSNFPEASLHYLPRQFNTDAHGLAKEAIRSREEA
uniref:Reverse transcriptase domain-containing protein n=1 Tax=Cannabis sativa TaxID=3483 RepID=A0A803P9U8_CANSA